MEGGINTFTAGDGVNEFIGGDNATNVFNCGPGYDIMAGGGDNADNTYNENATGYGIIFERVAPTRSTTPAGHRALYGLLSRLEQGFLPVRFP